MLVGKEKVAKNKTNSVFQPGKKERKCLFLFYSANQRLSDLSSE